MSNIERRELSDLAKEMNEAFEPGSTTPARLWARSIIAGREIETIGIIVNGLHFLARRRMIFHGGGGGIAYTINGEPHVARAFELILAEQYPAEPLGMHEMFAKSKMRPIQYGVMLNDQHHRLELDERRGVDIFFLDGIEITKADFERYLRFSSLRRGGAKSNE